MSEQAVCRGREDEPVSLRSDARRLNHYAVARVEQFSDGVIAIAITVIVLQIAVPLAGNTGLLSELLDLWPSYLAYVISFLTIGGFWFAHHTIFFCLRTINPAVMRVNLLLLMAIAFLPFPTAVMAQDLTQTGPGGRVAVVFYGLSLLLCRLLLSWLWWVASKDHLIRTEIDREDLSRLTRRLNPGVLLYVIAIAVGVFLPDVGPWLYLLIAVYTVVTTRSVDFEQDEEGTSEQR